MGWDRTTVQLEPFTSNEPELHQYQYVRIPLQIWTPLVTHDSIKMRREWTVPLEATTPLQSIKIVAENESFQSRCF